MDDLKNCPFCGGEPLQGKHWVTWCDREYVVACECGAARSGDTKSEAITAWNTRADGWQDIADAPRDGWIWICDNRFKPSESSHLIAKWHPQLNCWQGRMNTKGRFTVWHEATHWQPLPTPPGGDHG